MTNRKKTSFIVLAATVLFAACVKNDSENNSKAINFVSNADEIKTWKESTECNDESLSEYACCGLLPAKVKRGHSYAGIISSSNKAGPFSYNWIVEGKDITISSGVNEQEVVFQIGDDFTEGRIDGIVYTDSLGIGCGMGTILVLDEE